MTLPNMHANTDLARVESQIEELKQSLLERDVILSVKVDSKVHDREIRTDGGRILKIGRGLDF